MSMAVLALDRTGFSLRLEKKQTDLKEMQKW